MFKYVKQSFNYRVGEWIIDKRGYIFHIELDCYQMSKPLSSLNLKDNICHCGVDIPNKVKVISKLRQL